MDVQVLIERVEGNGYLARSAFGLTAQGATAEEALQGFRAELQRRLSAGGQLTIASLPSTTPPPNPWLSIIGTWNPSDPVIQEWEQILEANRRAADNDPNVF